MPWIITCIRLLSQVPGLLRYLRSRGQLQQQAGVQITSSTIYTSTVHIARVNVRNASIGTINGIQNPVPVAAVPIPPQPQNATGSPDQPAAGNVPDSMTNHLRFPGLNPQQAGTAPGSGLLNPFGSFLLWILGGGASDGIISFFSMFRDVRDPNHGQDFAPPDNDPASPDQHN